MNVQQKVEEKALKASMIGAFVLALWGLLIAARYQAEGAMMARVRLIFWPLSVVNVLRSVVSRPSANS